MWEVLGRGEVWRGHFINKRKDGQIFEEEATIAPVRDANGMVINFVAIKRDVTREAQLARRTAVFVARRHQRDPMVEAPQPQTLPVAK